MQRQKKLAKRAHPPAVKREPVEEAPEQGDETEQAPTAGMPRPASVPSIEPASIVRARPQAEENSHVDSETEQASTAYSRRHACRGLRQCLRSIHRACPPPTGTAKQSRPRPPAYPLPRRCDAHAKRWPHSHACHSYFGSRGMSSLRRLFRAELVAGAG